MRNGTDSREGERDASAWLCRCCWSPMYTYTKKLHTLDSWYQLQNMLSGFVTIISARTALVNSEVVLVCFLYLCWTFVLEIVLSMLSWVTLRLSATVKQEFWNKTFLFLGPGASTTYQFEAGLVSTKTSTSQCDISLLSGWWSNWAIKYKHKSQHQYFS